MLSIVDEFRAYPRQGHFKEKRRLILRQAAELFVERGVNGTSLSDIADTFGMTKPAVYHYVRSKDEIITAILEEAFSRWTDGGPTIRDTPGKGIDRFRKALEVYVQSTDSEFSLFLASVRANGFSSDARALYVRVHRQILDEMSRLVEGGIEDGSIQARTPKITVLTAVSALNAMTVWHNPDGPLSLTEARDEVISTLIDGIRRSSPPMSRAKTTDRVRSSDSSDRSSKETRRRR